MFYEIINKYQIKRAPYPLSIDERYVFTDSETIYNSQGYYKLEREEYPQDEKNYQSYYTLEDNKIIQKWDEVE